MIDDVITLVKSFVMTSHYIYILYAKRKYTVTHCHTSPQTTWAKVKKMCETGLDLVMSSR